MDVQVELHDLRSLSMYDQESELSVTSLFDQQAGLSLLYLNGRSNQIHVAQRLKALELNSVALEGMLET